MPGLQECAAAGDLEGIREALEQGCKLGDANPEGCTPLMQLVQAEKWAEAADVAGWANHDCAINAQHPKTLDGALHMALSSPETPPGLIAQLMRRGADATLANAAGTTPLRMCLAAEASQATAVIEHLDVKHVDSKTAGGKTLFAAAQEAGNTALMAALIRKGADVHKSATALAKRALAEKDDALLGAVVLTAKQSVLDILDFQYKHLVAEGFPHAAAQYLKRTQKEIGAAVGDEGGTYLHKCAAEQGSAQLCVELIAAGVGANAQDDKGNTPLHVAAKSCNLEVARALCEHGADVMARNKSNRTPKMVPKIDATMKAYLYDMEELHKEGKLQQQHELWDERMKGTQSESAFGIRAL